MFPDFKVMSSKCLVLSPKLNKLNITKRTPSFNIRGARTRERVKFLLQKLGITLRFPLLTN